MSPKTETTGQDPSAVLPLEALPLHEQAERLDKMLAEVDLRQEQDLRALHGDYEAHIDDPTIDGKAFMGATGQLDNLTHDILKGTHKDVRELLSRRSDVNQQLIARSPEALDLLNKVTRQADIYGVDSRPVQELLEQASPRLQGAIGAVLDTHRYRRAHRDADVYGPDGNAVRTTVANATPHARAAINASLDRKRYAETIKGSSVYGSDSHAVQQRKSGMSKALSGVTDSVLDKQRLQAARRGASVYGVDSHHTQASLTNASSIRASQIMRTDLYETRSQPASRAPGVQARKAESTASSALAQELYEREMADLRALAKDYERRKPRRRIGTWMAAAGVAVAATIGATQSGALQNIPKVVASSVPNPGSPAPEAPGASQEAAPTATPEPKIPSSESGICLSPRDEALLKSDCYYLPRIYEGARFTPLDKDDPKDPPTLEIGTVIDGELDLSKLPDSYQDAIKAALSDPYVAAVQKQIPLHIEQAADESDENGWYIPDDKIVKLVFSADKDQKDADTIYPTWGSIRDTLVHEDTHAVYDMLLEKSLDDEQLSADMTQMNNLCRDMVRPWVANSYESHRKEMKQWIKGMKSAVKKFHADGLMSSEDAAVFNAAIRKTQFQFSTQKRFVNASITPSGDCDVFLPSQVFYSNMSNQEISIYDYVPDGGGDTYWDEADKFSSINKPINEDLLKQSLSMREGGLLKGLDTYYAGHPFNTTEQWASTMASIHMNPEGYVKAVLALPEGQRANRIQFTIMMHKTLVKQFPELADDTNMSEVVKALQTAA